jgi:hypothetical protein
VEVSCDQLRIVAGIEELFVLAVINHEFIKP